MSYMYYVHIGAGVNAKMVGVNVSTTLTVGVVWEKEFSTLMAWMRRYFQNILT